jgi:hypothetical protein
MLVLVSLIVCHYLADFCLTWPGLIRAKADGKNFWPIALHATVHTLLMGICLYVYGIEWQLLCMMMILELTSHFIIDTAKACLTVRFPYLADVRCKPYWMLYGFDQLLHLFVVIIIWYCCLFNGL